MLQIHGIAKSRTQRCLWMLEEMGLRYEIVERRPRPEELRTEEYLRLNPNGLIPTLVDGGFVIWETAAINLYLAHNYPGPLHADSPQVLGKAMQWSIWAAQEVEALAHHMLQHRVLLVEYARDPSKAERDELLLQRPFRVLERSLLHSEYLAGDAFTVADLNVIPAVAYARRAELDFSVFPQVARWLDACTARPAYRRIRETFFGT